MTAESASTAARLCGACGMCCDGVLFHAVVLQPGDSARALAALGLRVKRKKGREFFRQPCVAHEDSRCTIYDQRPARCRLFACRQLLRVASGEATEVEALEKIHAARARVGEVNALMGRVADTNPNRALAQRYANAMAGPEQGSDREALKTAMDTLEALLAADFRVE